MEVVYRSIMEDIIDIHTKAEISNRTIKHIVLTNGEYNQLAEEVFKNMNTYPCDTILKDGVLGEFYGIKLIKGWK